MMTKKDDEIFVTMLFFDCLSYSNYSIYFMLCSERDKMTAGLQYMNASDETQ